jgi:hypothetical protein
MAMHDFAGEEAASLLGFLEQAGRLLHNTTAELCTVNLVAGVARAKLGPVLEEGPDLILSSPFRTSAYNGPARLGHWKREEP